MNMTTTITGLRELLSDTPARKLLIDAKDHQTSSLPDTDALLVKDLEERANTPLKLNPVGERWHCGVGRSVGKVTIKRGRQCNYETRYVEKGSQ